MDYVPSSFTNYIENLKSKKGAALEFNEVSPFYLQLAETLEYFRSVYGFFHRDMHMSNVMTNGSNEPMLIDFGRSYFKNYDFRTLPPGITEYESFKYNDACEDKGLGVKFSRQIGGSTQGFGLDFLVFSTHILSSDVSMNFTLKHCLTLANLFNTGGGLFKNSLYFNIALITDILGTESPHFLVYPNTVQCVSLKLADKHTSVEFINDKLGVQMNNFNVHMLSNNILQLSTLIRNIKNSQITEITGNVINDCENTIKDYEHFIVPHLSAINPIEYDNFECFKLANRPEERLTREGLNTDKKKEMGRLWFEKVAEPLADKKAKEEPIRLEEDKKKEMDRFWFEKMAANKESHKMKPTVIQLENKIAPSEHIIHKQNSSRRIKRTFRGGRRRAAKRTTRSLATQY
jgi:hypothetical protein